MVQHPHFVGRVITIGAEHNPVVLAPMPIIIWGVCIEISNKEASEIARTMRHKATSVPDPRGLQALLPRNSKISISYCLSQTILSIEGFFLSALISIGSIGTRKHAIRTHDNFTSSRQPVKPPNNPHRGNKRGKVTQQPTELNRCARF